MKKIVLLASLAGCQTGKPAPSTAQDAPKESAGDPQLEQAYQEEIRDVGLETGDWRVVLEVDIDDVEEKGEAFLATGFKLYDTLLASEKVPPSASEKAAFDALYQQALKEYGVLVKSVQRLATDIDRPEIRLHIPTMKRDHRETFSKVAELCDWFKPPKKAGVYDFAGGLSMTNILFGDPENPETKAGDGLSKAQKDALLLLTQLRNITDDLSYLSTSVTNWTLRKEPEIERRNLRERPRP